MSIYILSRPIHSGKTTQLQNWCARQKDAAGVLMPDINNQRCILDIQTKESFIIQCNNPDTTNELLMNIGRYHFYAVAFGKANTILLQASTGEHDWLVIDELGRLEMEGKGFYSSAQEIIHSKKYRNLLLVIRDSLCEQVITFFKITEYTIIHQVDELP